MNPINRDELRGHLETMVLSVLEKGEGHGLEIMRRLEAAGSGALRLREGTLYPALYRLENARLIRARWEKQPKGKRGPRKRIYQLTSRGRGQLNKGRQSWKHFVSVIGPIVEAAT